MDESGLQSLVIAARLYEWIIMARTMNQLGGNTTYYG